MGKSLEKTTNGWFCQSGRHLWFEKEDAEKCCHPEWKRCLAIKPGTDAVYSYYWLHTNSGPAAR